MIQPATRPEPLPRTGISAPDGKSFPWGPIQVIHCIGDYQIVEYHADRSSYSSRDWDHEHGKTRFQPYIDGKSTGQGFYSLDSALIGAIAYRRCGPNVQAAQYFDLMTLGVINDQEQSS